MINERNTKPKKSFMAYVDKLPVIGEPMSGFLIMSDSVKPLSSYVITSERVTRIVNFSEFIQHIKIVYTPSCIFYVMLLDHDFAPVIDYATFVAVDNYDSICSGKFFVYHQIIFENYYPRLFTCKVDQAVSVSDKNGVKVVTTDSNKTFICIP